MLEHIFHPRPIARLRLPATPQNTPNIVREPSPLRPLGSLRPLAPKHLRNSGILAIPGKWNLPGQNLVHHHSERVTIGGPRPAAVFGTEHFWLEEFRAHPSGRTTLFARACGCRIQVHRDQTEIGKSGIAGVVDQDVILTDECR